MFCFTQSTTCQLITVSKYRRPAVSSLQYNINLYILCSSLYLRVFPPPQSTFDSFNNYEVDEKAFILEQTVMEWNSHCGAFKDENGMKVVS
jgi:hypothetical protein